MKPEQLITQLLGTPYAPSGNTYDALDCFGVVEIWYRDALGIEVEDRAMHPPTHSGLNNGVESASEWESIDGPEDHCLVLMQSGRLIHGHIGVYYRGKVIHSDRKHNACVCQPLDDRQIKPYVTGFLRHK